MADTSRPDFPAHLTQAYSSRSLMARASSQQPIVERIAGGRQGDAGRRQREHRHGHTGREGMQAVLQALARRVLLAVSWPHGGQEAQQDAGHRGVDATGVHADHTTTGNTQSNHARSSRYRNASR